MWNKRRFKNPTVFILLQFFASRCRFQQFISTVEEEIVLVGVNSIVSCWIVAANKIRVWKQNFSNVISKIRAISRDHIETAVAAADSDWQLH